MAANKTSMTMAKRNLMMGILMLIFAISFYAMTYHFTGYGFEKMPGDVGPDFLPRLTLAALALESIFLIFFSLMEIGKGVTDSIKPAPFWHRRPIIMFGTFLVYIYLSTLFGYITSTIAFMLLSFYLLGVRKVWMLVVIPPATTFATYYLFESLLNVYLPTGSLF
jgi:putative tricarboxylic transport membrane protein